MKGHKGLATYKVRSLSAPSSGQHGEKRRAGVDHLRNPKNAIAFLSTCVGQYVANGDERGPRTGWKEDVVGCRNGPFALVTWDLRHRVNNLLVSDEAYWVTNSPQRGLLVRIHASYSQNYFLTTVFRCKHTRKASGI